LFLKYLVTDAEDVWKLRGLDGETFQAYLWPGILRTEFQFVVQLSDNITGP
jgi:hypothetical protein